MTFRPLAVSTVAGQEFRLDVMGGRGEPGPEAMATVSYDPALVEFRRVGPGAAAISSRATDGQVILTIRRQGMGEAGETVLAMLFFHAKAKGETRVTLQANAPGLTSPAGASGTQLVMVHVH
jgi:hypothetical protein